MPKVSFIVPIYNKERFLNRCLDSILNQTDFDYEVIMVDDGSTDASPVICKKYINSRFKYIYQNNAGVSAARNTGIDAATGEYLAFIDADDWIASNYISVIYSYAKNTNADILCFGFKRNINDGIVIDAVEDKVIDISDHSVLKHFCQDWLLPQRRNYVHTKLFKNAFSKGDAFEDVRFNTSEDARFNTINEFS